MMEAIGVTQDIKQNASKKSIGHKITRKKSPTKTGPVGSAFPNINTSFTHNRFGIRELEETARVAPVARSLWQLQLIAFPYFEFSILAPRGMEVKESDSEKLLPKMEEIDRKIRTSICCAQTMYDVITYGSAIFEVAWGKDDEGWIVPIALQRLPAASFAQAPSGVSGNTTRYQCGRLLKGIVLDKEDGSYHYYQMQDSTSGTPVEIPNVNVIHIKDSNSMFVDGEPYIAGIVNTISQLEFVRKRFMQTISRVGSPQMKVTVGVPPEYLPKDDTGLNGITSALPGSNETFADAMFTQLWEYGQAVAENVSSDVAFAVPKGIDVDWQRPSVPINPTDVDSYLIREAVSHIFPRDVLEVLSNSISSTSAPLLELLKVMVQGWQQICAIPFENKLWTKFVEVNGFKNYRVELDWAPLIPEDSEKENEIAFNRAVQLFDRHLITVEEVRGIVTPMINVANDESIEEKKKVLYEEILAYKVPQSLMQQPAMPGMPPGMEGMLGGEAPPGIEGEIPMEEGTVPEEMGTEEEAPINEEMSEEDSVMSEADALLAELEASGFGEE